MALLSDRDRRATQDRLKIMENPVKLVHFTQELECPSCPETRRLLQEVAELSDKLSLEIHNFQLDRDKATQYGVDKSPGTAVEGAKDYGIRCYGPISGYEFATLLDAILTVSRGRSELSPATVERLRALDQPLHLQVFVTPT
jgi:alkyl hydroperoxide reductase subunit AhpF